MAVRGNAGPACIWTLIVRFICGDPDTWDREQGPFFPGHSGPLQQGHGLEMTRIPRQGNLDDILSMLMSLCHGLRTCLRVVDALSQLDRDVKGCLCARRIRPTVRGSRASSPPRTYRRDGAIQSILVSRPDHDDPGVSAHIHGLIIAA